ncbi:MAG: DNA topoisomerase III [Verrucomicrobiota bacterium]|nr:DNA topoisomerase III [Verrucomicrobiota bacterium]MCC6821500.1 DNA topoisomerase III [Limisphaerales bacterium]
MGKKLIIAEKPSVASDISKALGKFQKQDDYFENDEYVISSAVGHLLTIVPPAGVEAVRGKWTFKCLPVIPPHFDLLPIEKNENRLKVLVKLIKRKDVDGLINACDAGREGELIFRNIIRYTKAKQPIKRLWLQSMTAGAIREGFAALRDDASMQPLSDAATSRSEADWLVGINGTRAMTAFNSKSGGFHLTTVGRVQTPTLAILVDREEKIKKFVPRGYWEIHGTFAVAAGDYPGRWFDEKFSRQEGDEQLRPERVWDVKFAETLRDKCLGKPGIVTEESKPTTSLSPLLYDLTSLQRDGNSRFGFSAKNTLGLAQALYEKHKVLTYPRTDSRALPEDYVETVKQTLGMLGGTHYGSFAGHILQSGWVRPNKRIFNNAKVSDHFAIIPTLVAPKGLSEPEQKLYDLVTKRFLAIFYPAAEFQVTTRITRVEGEPFKSEGKVMVNAGWLAVYGKEAETDDTPSLVPVKPNETVKTVKIEVEANVTKPPPRYSEATLLSAMEGAGKLVEDEELREAMSEKGLGTPATRAQIIEGLIWEKYVHRNGRELQPTAKAFSIITLLRGLDIPELCSPELTGNWEFKLRQISRGQLQRGIFMEEIAAATRAIVAKAARHESDTVPGDFGTLKVPCPKCGGEIHENYKKFQCQKCDYALWKIVAGRQLEIAEVEELLSKGVVGPLQGFRSKMGRPFAAVIKMGAEFKPEFDFGNDQNADGATVEVDFTGKEPLGKCPKCDGRVFENGMNYVCEKATGSAKTCDFRTGAVILQQPVDKAQMVKLLATGKTDLLTKFISKRNNRPFKAYLAVGKEGKIGFEFPPREAKAGRVGPGTAPREPQPKLDFSGQTPLGQCPKCGGKVFEGPQNFLCEKSQLDAKACKFNVGKTILEQPIEREQVQKLLIGEKTDVLSKFISAKTGKPFAAYLVMDQKGKITFDFPPRDGE